MEGRSQRLNKGDLDRLYPELCLWGLPGNKTNGLTRRWGGLRLVFQALVRWQRGRASGAVCQALVAFQAVGSAGKAGVWDGQGGALRSWGLAGGRAGKDRLPLRVTCVVSEEPCLPT